MYEIIVGICLAGFIGWLISYNKRKALKLKPGHWVIIGFCCLYSVFVIELVGSFIREGAIQAALVMGGIFGFVAILAWVLITRYLLLKKSTS